MPDLPTRLGVFFAAPQTRTMASLAPSFLVAGAAGLIIGAAVATPAFAAAGLGLVLTSLAANIASALVYDIVKPDLDASERERAIAEGLKNRDPGVLRLVAEALAGGGPAVAQALPAPLRAELIDTLRQGMQQPGGALAAIATPYTQALASPPADWGALQAELRASIRRVSQTIEATGGGVVSGAHQVAPNAGGSIEQVIRASGPGSRAEHISQVVSGGRRAAGGLANPAGEQDSPQHLQRLLANHIKRLEKLEESAASMGLHTPPHTLTEIDDARAEIARLRALLGA